ncbi:MAG: FtsQ-type POTRA domain-containing protein [Dehalococcoidia bacterium]|nr:FtsQ-type POTRA domain-containing protein [Dehalococcoidia bacterium]
MPKDRSPRRRPERKTTQPAPIRRGVRWRLFLALLPLVLVAAGTFTLLRSPWLTVQEIRIAGAETLDAAGLAELSDLQGRSMLSLPVDEATERLQALPQVRTASISREWPQTVTIHVEERVPFAFWSTGNRDYVVDADGVVLAAGVPSGPAPRIVEPGDRILAAGDRVHPDALTLADRIMRESPRFLGQSIRELEYRAGIGVTAVFTNNLRVTFGDERSYEYKVAVLAKLLDQLSLQGYAPRSVDLRFGERVTYE